MIYQSTVRELSVQGLKDLFLPGAFMVHNYERPFENTSKNDVIKGQALDCTVCFLNTQIHPGGILNLINKYTLYFLQGLSDHLSVFE